MLFYVYKITNKKTGEYYIGKSKCSGNPIEHSYYGSGNWIRNSAKEICKLKNIPSCAKRRHFIDQDFVKEILYETNDEIDSYNKEMEFIGDLWKTDSLCMNESYGGLVSGFNFSKGVDRWNYDTTIYTFYNIISDVLEKLTRREFIEKYELGETAVYNVIKGISNHVKHWYCNIHFENDELFLSKIKKANYKNIKIYEFYNVKTKEIVKSTAYFLYKHYDLNRQLVYKILKKSRYQAYGWFCNVENIETEEFIKKSEEYFIFKSRESLLDNKQYIFKNNKTKEIICSTRITMKNKYGLSDSGLSQLIKGNIKTHKNWSVCV